MNARETGLAPPEMGEAGISSELTRPQIKATTNEFSSTGPAGVKPAHDPGCHCRAGAICIVCLKWNRRIRQIEQRRADSLRLQDLGRRAAGGT